MAFEVQSGDNNNYLATTYKPGRILVVMLLYFSHADLATTTTRDLWWLSLQNDNGR